MRRIPALLFTLLISLWVLSPGRAQQINLSFEVLADTKDDLYPLGWDMTFSEEGASGYLCEVTADHAMDGDYAVRIQPDPASTVRTFGAVSYWVPLTFDGDSVTLKGYVKTEDLSDGYAGLWIRLNGIYGSYGYADMKSDSLTGTHDWKEYAVTIPLHDEANDLRVGGLITGEGKLWIDHLQIFVDGKPYTEAPGRKPLRMKFPAMADTEFSEGSDLKEEELGQIKDLALVGKVWGFAKYHHPAVAEGEHNMDAELIRLLHSLARQKKVEEEILLDWLRSLGEVKACDPCEIVRPENAAVFPDHNWITREVTNPALTRQLQSVYHDRKYSRHYYFTPSPNIGNVNFEHELTYDQMDYPDAGYRLLALYRYWNMINYFFPYRDITDKSWNEVLEDYIPELLQASDALTYRLAMLRVIGEVKDTHANIWGNDKYIQGHLGRRRPAIMVRFAGEALVVCDYYQDSLGRSTGILPGDVISSVNGRAVRKIRRDMEPISPASNQAARLRDIAKKILRTNEKKIELTINRQGGQKTMTIPTYDPASTPGFNLALEYGDGYRDSTYFFIDEEVVYLNNSKLKNDMLNDLKEEVKNSRGIIIDARNYPTDFLVFTLGAWLYPEPTEFVRFTRMEGDVPGWFVLIKPLTTGRKTQDYYRGKVAILVNERTQSTAEYHAMAYRQAAQAKVFGSTTAGADGNVSAIRLPGGIFSYISGIGVFYPDGSPTQRVGIVPDKEVHPTIEGIRSGRDEVLEAALQWIQTD